MFAARGIVQLTLFRHNATGWLAFARIVMGFPLYVVAVGGGFWVVSRARRQLLADARRTSALSSPRMLRRIVLLGIGQRDEQQFVSGLERLLGRGRDHAAAPDDRDDGGVLRQGQFAHRPAGARRLVGQGDLEQVRLPLAQAEQPHDVADLDGLLDE